MIITGRRKDAVEKAASELGVSGLIADQSSLTDIHALARAVTERYGQIDILIVNAGVTKFSLIEDMPEAVFDQVMNVNF
ncbi:Sepiapterin reductase [compost metagenome]